MAVIFKGPVKIGKYVVVENNPQLKELTIEGDTHNHYYTDNSSHPTQVNNGVQPQAGVAHCVQPSLMADAQLVNNLLPFFKMNQESVQSFLSAVGGMKNRDITRLVNAFVKSQAIDTTMAKGNLFELLQTHKIYNGSKSTWNDQVDFK